MEAKDSLRVSELLTRAKGDATTAIHLAQVMANSIRVKNKAGRRANASISLNGNDHPITKVFLMKYEELSGKVVQPAKEVEPTGPNILPDGTMEIGDFTGANMTALKTPDDLINRFRGKQLAFVTDRSHYEETDKRKNKGSNNRIIVVAIPKEPIGYGQGLHQISMVEYGKGWAWNDEARDAIEPVKVGTAWTKSFHGHDHTPESVFKFMKFAQRNGSRFITGEGSHLLIEQATKEKLTRRIERIGELYRENSKVFHNRTGRSDFGRANPQGLYYIRNGFAYNDSGETYMLDGKRYFWKDEKLQETNDTYLYVSSWLARSNYMGASSTGTGYTLSMKEKRQLHRNHLDVQRLREEIRNIQREATGKIIKILKK